VNDEPEVVDIEESESPKVQALLALKEVEFDRATGKLSDEDYAELKARYAAAALEAIKVEETTGSAVAGVVTADAVLAGAAAALERAMDGGATCPACGPRPETNAAFCSSCGRLLTRDHTRPRCHGCGAALAEGARFCAACGIKTAA
jgi:hypothetical protein